VTKASAAAPSGQARIGSLPGSGSGVSGGRVSWRVLRCRRGAERSRQDPTQLGHHRLSNYNDVLLGHGLDQVRTEAVGGQRAGQYGGTPTGRFEPTPYRCIDWALNYCVGLPSSAQPTRLAGF